MIASHGAPRRTPSAEAVIRELAGGPLTALQIAERTGMRYMGVSSCLTAMRKRREVKRTIAKPGTPALWRLP